MSKWHHVIILEEKGGNALQAASKSASLYSHIFLWVHDLATREESSSKTLMQL